MLEKQCESCFGEWYGKGCGCDNGFVTVDEEEIVFVNVYSVTRHYGGAEEGGWWYNWNECIEVYPTRNKNSDQVKAELLAAYEGRKHGNIYSVLGGLDIDVYIEREPKQSETTERPHYE